MTFQLFYVRVLIGEAFILGPEKKNLKRGKLHLHYENLADGGLVK